MKTTYLPPLLIALALLLPTQMLWSQKSNDKKFEKYETPRFIPETENPDYIYLPLGFNQSEFSSQLDKIEPHYIKSISLIYSQFRVSETFDQYTFNHERMEALFSKYPKFKSNKEIKWNWIGQTGCNSPEECKSYFHGFEIQLYSEEEIQIGNNEVELTEFYTNLFLDMEGRGKVVLDSLSKIPNSGISKQCDTSIFINKKRKSNIGKLTASKHNEAKFGKLMNRKSRHGLNEFSIHYNPTFKKPFYIKGSDISDSKKKYAIKKFKRLYRHSPARLEGTILPAEIKVSVDPNKKVSMYYLNTNAEGENIDLTEELYSYTETIRCNYTDSGYHRGKSARIFNSQDDVVLKVLDRNTQWKNCVIVADVTGSMYPYMGQFLAWHQLNLKQSKNPDFVFFNDGNNMPDSKKKVGKVGGLFDISTQDYDKLLNQVSEAQKRGNGGDGQENDIEAVLHALKTNPKAQGIILIADNFIQPRDLELLSKVKKPIHVILCGAFFGVNIAYLNLVRKNGGSLHTIEQDLKNLAKLSEGESIAIDKQVFKIKNGDFVLDTEASKILQEKASTR